MYALISERRCRVLTFNMEFPELIIGPKALYPGQNGNFVSSATAHYLGCPETSRNCFLPNSVFANSYFFGVI
jgi:hypothetical protein